MQAPDPGTPGYRSEKKRSSFRRIAGRILVASKPFRGSVKRMSRPIQPALTDAASGRMSMPFLPTLAVVIALAAASVFCPSSDPVPPSARLDVAAASAPGPTAFAEPAPVATPARLPASLAFAEAYPLTAAPVSPASLASTSVAIALRASPVARGVPHLASAARKPCAGRRCTEIPQRASDPLTVARKEEVAEGAAGGFLPPMALPFASVVETLAPAARIVGEAAGLMRSGAASVKGSVVLLADCLP